MHFLYDHIGKEDENLGSVKQSVNSIDVSSYSVSHTLIFMFDKSLYSFVKFSGEEDF